MDKQPNRNIRELRTTEPGSKIGEGLRSRARTYGARLAELAVRAVEAGYVRYRDWQHDRRPERPVAAAPAATQPEHSTPGRLHLVHDRSTEADQPSAAEAPDLLGPPLCDDDPGATLVMRRAGGVAVRFGRPKEAS